MTKYTKRHYVEIANIIANEICHARDEYGVIQEHLFHCFDKLFQADNENYKSDVFRKACELQKDEEDYARETGYQKAQDEIKKDVLEELGAWDIIKDRELSQGVHVSQYRDTGHEGATWEMLSPEEVERRRQVYLNDK